MGHKRINWDRTCHHTNESTGKIAKATKCKSKLKQNWPKSKLQWARLVPKLGLQSLLRKKPSEIEEKAAEEEAIEQTLPEKGAASAPEALKESIEYIICHASGKRLSKKNEKLNTMP